MKKTWKAEKHRLAQKKYYQMNKSTITKRRAKRLRDRFRLLKRGFGNSCFFCGSMFNMQFAHRQKTGLHGAGRGKISRYYDIAKNPTKYFLLCKECHKDYDSHENTN
jgi:hypothetical protein